MIPDIPIWLQIAGLMFGLIFGGSLAWPMLEELGGVNATRWRPEDLVL